MIYLFPWFRIFSFESTMNRNVCGKNPAVGQSEVCACAWVVRKPHEFPPSRVAFRADTLNMALFARLLHYEKAQSTRRVIFTTLGDKWVGCLRILSLLQVSRNENVTEYTLRNYLPTAKCSYESSRLNTRITCPFIVPHTSSVKVWCLQPLNA
jgi:hypothetical protein